VHVSSFDIAIIVFNFVLLTGVGLFFSRRQTSQDEYYLGNRRVHWLLAGGSVLATLLSTITYLSIPGEMVRHGITFFATTAAIPLAVPVVNRVIMPAIRRRPYRSAYEYLKQRYGNTARTLASVVFVVHTLVWSSIIFYTASLAVAEAGGFPLTAVIVVMGLLTIFYTTLGGMRTVIWTDNLQLLILFGGAIAVPLWVASLTGTGPGAWWDSFSQAGRSEVIYFSWDPTVRLTVFGVILGQLAWEICAHSSDQVAVQRYLSTPGLDEARRTFWTYAVFRVLLALCLGFCGLALFAFYAAQSGAPLAEFQRQVTPVADRLMPRFIAEELPSGLTGLLLAAMLAAAMSSLSSAMNSVGGVVSTDFLGRQDLSMVLERGIVVAGGTTGIVLALAIQLVVTRTGWNIVELSGRLNHIFVGPLASLFFAGVLVRRVTERGALAGFAAGVAVSLVICFGPISFTWMVPVSLLTGVGVAVLASQSK
jgi:SSS family transporter